MTLTYYFINYFFIKYSFFVNFYFRNRTILSLTNFKPKFLFVLMLYYIFFIKNDLIKWLLPLNFNINIKYLIFVKFLYLITFNFIKNGF